MCICGKVRKKEKFEIIFHINNNNFITLLLIAINHVEMGVFSKALARMDWGLRINAGLWSSVNVATFDEICSSVTSDIGWDVTIMISSWSVDHFRIRINYSFLTIKSVAKDSNHIKARRNRLLSYVARVVSFWLNLETRRWPRHRNRFVKMINEGIPRFLL